MNTILQHLADDEKRGRIMGLFTVTWAGLIPFGGIWMGVVAETAGAPLAVGIGAAVCTVFALGVLVRGAITRTSASVGRGGVQLSTEPPR
jgi:hypothetical protein